MALLDAADSTEKAVQNVESSDDSVSPTRVSRRKKRHATLTLEDRLNIIRYAETHSRAETIEAFQIAPSTFCRTVSNKSSWLDFRDSIHRPVKPLIQRESYCRPAKVSNTTIVTPVAGRSEGQSSRSVTTAGVGDVPEAVRNTPDHNGTQNAWLQLYLHSHVLNEAIRCWLENAKQSNMPVTMATLEIVARQLATSMGLGDFSKPISTADAGQPAASASASHSDDLHRGEDAATPLSNDQGISIRSSESSDDGEWTVAEPCDSHNDSRPDLPIAPPNEPVSAFTVCACNCACSKHRFAKSSSNMDCMVATAPTIAVAQYEMPPLKPMQTDISNDESFCVSVKSEHETASDCAATVKETSDAIATATTTAAATASATGTRKIKALSIEKRLQLIQYIKDGHNAFDAAERFQVGVSTAYRIWTDRQQWLTVAAELSDKQRQFRVKTPKRRWNNSVISKDLEAKLNDAVCDWFHKAKLTGQPISRKMLKIVALDAAIQLGIRNFNAPDGWVRRLQKSRNIALKPPKSDPERPSHSTQDASSSSHP